MTAARTFGLIPAAGHSRRMGRPKLSLPLGNRTVLEWVVAALREGGIAEVLVVVGPHVPELAPFAQAAGASVLQLAEETPDMRATIEHGLAWLEERFQPGPHDGFLLVPADHPTLEASVVRDLLAAQKKHPEYSIFVPTFEVKRGHPTWIAWKHVASLRAFSPGQGLNAYLRQWKGETLEIPVDSASVLLDLDTPAEYELLKLTCPETTRKA